MKINIRKGLFETSSSSEDSLSVYQDMKLFILSKDKYEKFINNYLYIKLDDIHPSYLEDYQDFIDANEGVIYSNKISRHLVGQVKTIYDISTYILFNHKHQLYFDYKTYVSMLRSHYDNVDLFNYENNDDMIFGFYGYTQE